MKKVSRVIGSGISTAPENLMGNTSTSLDTKNDNSLTLWSDRKFFQSFSQSNATLTKKEEEEEPKDNTNKSVWDFTPDFRSFQSFFEEEDKLFSFGSRTVLIVCRHGKIVVSTLREEISQSSLSGSIASSVQQRRLQAALASLRVTLMLFQQSCNVGPGDEFDKLDFNLVLG